MTHGDCVARVMQRRGYLNPLLEAPWVKTSIFKMDWLHAADQGIVADFIGNVLYHFSSQFPGGTKDERYTALFQEIMAYYEAEDVQDRLDALKPTFIESRQGMTLM